jgi:hypothetical protein
MNFRVFIYTSVVQPLCKLSLSSIVYSSDILCSVLCVYVLQVTRLKCRSLYFEKQMRDWPNSWAVCEKCVVWWSKSQF